MYRILFLLLSISSSLPSTAQSLSGFISDSLSGEKLAGASIFDLVGDAGTFSNDHGYYSFQSKGESQVCFSYVGYETRCFNLQTLGNIKNFNVELSPSIQLDAIEITGEALNKVEEHIGRERIKIEDIKKLPMFLGEFDVLKAIQLLPGVQAGNEGQSGFFVRGGSPDQNLILLDGVPVYNVAHLFGFFSIFNGSAIKDVDFIKGGFPARYGGRLSSILDIRLKEGNLKKFSGTATVGLISSQFMLEGPIWKDRTSFLVTGRRTYLDFLFKNLTSNRSGQGYYFYDGTAKINHKINAKNQLFASYYGGRDQLYGNEKAEEEGRLNEAKIGLGWTNQTASLRWNRVWSPKLFSNASLTYTNYFLNDDRLDRTTVLDTKEQEFYSLNYKATIRDYGAKMDFDYIANNNLNFKFGGNMVRHFFSPGVFNLKDDLFQDYLDKDTTIINSESSPNEYFGYLEADLKIGKTKFNVGAHLTAFDLGENWTYSAQPRFSALTQLDDKSSLKLGITNMRQHIHILINDGLGLPIDLWVPSTDRIKPQESWLYALGYSRKLRDGYQLTVESYYKTSKNLLAYQEGKGVYGFEDWQNKITQGQGLSYGLELLLQKETGKLTGWLGYTLSKTSVQFDEVNRGKWYPLKYDRRHDFSAVGNYQLTSRSNISATWVYSTGIAYTLSNSKYYVPLGKDYYLRDIFDLGERVDKNNWRLRPYHRLDIGYNIEKKFEKYTRTWSFGAYNAYSRVNSVYASTTTIKGEGKLVERGLFPIIPYVSIKFDF